MPLACYKLKSEVKKMIRGEIVTIEGKEYIVVDVLRSGFIVLCPA